MAFDFLSEPPAVPDDARIVADLRTDHAGETGAVFIYRGILAISRDDVIRAFAAEHLRTEAEHLAMISAVLPAPARSKLTGLWKVMGWLTGALPALFGRNWVFRTIEAVETFVDHHYQEQIDYIGDRADAARLKALLVRCQADEVHHRDDAAARATGPAGPALRLWTSLVAFGSQSAVRAARII